VITLVLIGFVGGLITGISPCVLPVLPVVFLSGGVQAVGGQQDVSSRRARRRPYLIIVGLALSFSIFTLLGTLALSALPLPKDIIRWAGLAALVVLGIGMMFPVVQDLLERPFSRIRQRQVDGAQGGFLLGVALGAVYVPCAGPVLAAITVAGATDRIGLRTVALTVAFAVGTAAPLLVFALAGRGVAERIRAFRGRQRRVRFLAGVVMIALAVTLTFNVTDALQRTVPDYTASVNRALDHTNALKELGPQQSAALQTCADHPASVLQDCGKAPAVSGIQQWLNTADDMPLSVSALAGKVVLVDFWAYSCINCQRAIPHVEAWYDAYKAAGLVVVGVHTPEYAFEHVPGNVAAGAKRLHVTYPIALDNDYATWESFGNNSWPAEYLIDATGEVRHVAIGEGDYATSESLIRQLLTAANPHVALPRATDVPDATPMLLNQTPETYLGSERAYAYVTGEPPANGTHTFQFPPTLSSAQFGLSGTWTVGAEALTADQDAALALSFVAKVVYLDVGGTGTITATVDGKTTSVAVSGAPNIYPVFSGSTQTAGVMTVTLSPGLAAYSFTFG